MTLPSLHLTDTDRCRLGTLLFDRDSPAWGDQQSLANLELLLENCETTDARRTPENLVTMNTAVRLVDVQTGDPRTVMLVYPDDVDLAADGVSILEPLGVALLGRQVGDVIQCLDEEGQRQFRIVEVVYQPERNQAFHL